MRQQERGHATIANSTTVCTGIGKTIAGMWVCTFVVIPLLCTDVDSEGQRGNRRIGSMTKNFVLDEVIRPAKTILPICSFTIQSRQQQVRDRSCPMRLGIR